MIFADIYKVIQKPSLAMVHTAKEGFCCVIYIN